MGNTPLWRRGRLMSEPQPPLVSHFRARRPCMIMAFAAPVASTAVHAVGWTGQPESVRGHRRHRRQLKKWVHEIQVHRFSSDIPANYFLIVAKLNEKGMLKACSRSVLIQTKFCTKLKTYSLPMIRLISSTLPSIGLSLRHVSHAPRLPGNDTPLPTPPWSLFPKLSMLRNAARFSSS